MDATQQRDRISDGRFELKRQLGSGAFGEVWEAFDHRRKLRVAIKTLTRLDAAALYRFKREFRALQGVVHPNLVSLYELLTEEGQWFLTMDYVEGVDFLAYVRGVSSAAATASTAADPDMAAETYASDGDAADSSPPTTSPEAVQTPSTQPRGAADLAKLQAAALQLAQGVQALHEAGHLHRDLKHANVRVGPDGRVVLLDFGLVTNLLPEGGAMSVEFVGTPAYMSPEQAAGGTIDEASDWYSVGVMLYEALSGRLPFVGTTLKALMDKQDSSPPELTELVQDVPRDMAQLCHDLLQPNPGRRPRGPEILDRLASQVAATTARQATVFPATRLADEPFVGRSAQLASLRGAFEATQEGRAVVALVAGVSGIGKSALVQRFLAELAHEQPELVCLQGRCYQRESVPYKGLDAVIDALSHYLGHLPAGKAAAFLPRDLHLLSQLFPVLARLEGKGVRRQRPVADEVEHRQRAFAALRELLQRISTLHPLALVVDDLQWGDDDSGALLGELLHPPDPPAMLFVGIYRSDESEHSPLLARVNTELPPVDRVLERHLIEVLPLSEAEARSLTETLVEDRPELAAQADALVTECEGNPFFLQEVVRYLRTVGEQGAATPEPSLNRMVEARLAALAPAPRRLLELVAAAGYPIDCQAVTDAADLGPESAAAQAALQASHLVRTHGEGDQETIEAYHDRIREAVVASAPPDEQAAHHAALARVLAARGAEDPERLALHYLRAGDEPQAQQYLVRAARRAAEALAFDHAASLYAQALELTPTTDASRPELLIRQAEALANGGRAAEAGQAYLEAAEIATEQDPVDLMRRASEQLLKSGHFEQGLNTVRRVFHAVGLRLPGAGLASKSSAVWQHTRLHMRKPHIRLREPEEQSKTLLQQTDACLSAAMPLVPVDPYLAFALCHRGAFLALKAGEVDRIARGWASLSAVLATMYPEGRATRRAFEVATVAVKQCGAAKAESHLELAHVCYTLCSGRFLECVKHAERVEELLVDCRGVEWERITSRLVQVGALQWLGRWAELTRLLPGYVRTAEQRGDLYGSTSLFLTYGMFPRLVADEAEQVDEDLARYRDRWIQESKALISVSLDCWETIGRGYSGLYLNDPGGTLERIDDRWPVLKDTGTLETPTFYTELKVERINCLIMQLREAPKQRAATEKTIRKEIQRVLKKGTVCAPALAGLATGCLEAALGRDELALAALTEAEAELEPHQMKLHQAAARRLRGRILGGDEGATLVAEADEVMRAETIQNPARLAPVFAPGAGDDG